MTILGGGVLCVVVVLVLGVVAVLVLGWIVVSKGSDLAEGGLRVGHAGDDGEVLLVLLKFA